MNCYYCKRDILFYERIDHPKPTNEFMNKCKDCKMTDKKTESTDADRLDFIIQHSITVCNDGDGYFISGQWEADVFDTPREAIDHVMKEGLK